MLQVTPWYAVALGFLMAILSIRVPMRRGALDVPFGDGGDEPLATRIRAFGNFTEYVPMILLLLAISELKGAPTWSLHACGIGAVAFRVLHAVAYRARAQLSLSEKVGRGVAAMGTWLVLLGSVGLLARASL